MEVQMGAKIRNQIEGKRLSEWRSKLVQKWEAKWEEKGFQNGGPNLCKNGEPNRRKKVSRMEVQIGAKMGSQIEGKRISEWRSKLVQK